MEHETIENKHHKTEEEVVDALFVVILEKELYLLLPIIVSLKFMSLKN